MSNATRKSTEYMATVRIGSEFHAMYPTALATLCLQEALFAPVFRAYPPKCRKCWATIFRINENCGSNDIPPHWRPWFW